MASSLPSLFFNRLILGNLSTNLSKLFLTILNSKFVIFLETQKYIKTPLFIFSSFFILQSSLTTLTEALSTFCTTNFIFYRINS